MKKLVAIGQRSTSALHLPFPGNMPFPISIDSPWIQQSNSQNTDPLAHPFFSLAQPEPYFLVAASK